MNIYQYKQWLENFDIEILSKLDSMMARNPNYVLSPTLFTNFANAFRLYNDSVYDELDTLYSQIGNMSSVIKTSHINPLITFCEDIISNYIFDLFVIDDIKITSTNTFNTLPEYTCLCVDMDSVDQTFVNHFKIPVGSTILGDFKLYFQPVVDKNNGVFNIRSLSNICEYTFFNGSPVTNVSLNVYDSNLISPTTDNPLGTITCDITFKKVSSTSDYTNGFEQLPNILTTVLEFENVHESFEINNNKIINKRAMDVNYEMYVGNRYKQLSHNSELMLNPITYECDGPVDVIHLENQLLNRMVNLDYNNHTNKRMYFKPSQVMHLPIDDSKMTSVGGKYFEGQTLYLKSYDNRFLFPVIVTATDHSMSHGFVEAQVDDKRSRWVCVDDIDVITEYMDGPVTCEVIDDNMVNFLDEYNNSDYYYYTNGQINQHDIGSDKIFKDVYSLPGDPVYVANNADYVYTRLNYFFNGIIPNRFIDENSKLNKFTFIGQYFINSTDSEITIKMINHNMNELTNPEKYLVLRTEPNDHPIWDEEIRVLRELMSSTGYKIRNLNIAIEQKRIEVLRETKKYKKQELLIEYEDLVLKRNRETSYIRMLEENFVQLEQPTTWYNVTAYEDTRVYIDNGRAKIQSQNIKDNIRDLLYSDKLQVYLYDWENKMWLDPSTYTIQTHELDKVTLETYDDYTIDDILHSMTISPVDTWSISKKILIYFTYQKSDVYDNITIHPKTCSVMFKPDRKSVV